MSFTALPREDWAAIRERLVRDPVNKDTLDAISDGFNLISLETESPPIDVRDREREGREREDKFLYLISLTGSNSQRERCFPW